MSRTLGNITLPLSIDWSNRYNWTPITRTIDRTVSGVLIVWDQSLTNGKPITLSGNIDSGWFSTEQVNQLKQMAASLESVYTFIWDDETYQVVFDFTNGQPITMQAVLRGHPYWYGSINLLQVA